MQGNPSDTGGHRPTVSGALGYLGAGGARPFNYMHEPPPGMPWQNCDYVMHTVPITDARTGSRPSIEREGFELRDAPSAVADFRDEEAIRARYYAEAAELARQVTGAQHAYVFDHQIRRREAGRPALGFGRSGDGSRAAAVGRVHNDYSDASGLKRLALVLDDPHALSRTARFAIVNIWRSIRGPVVDTPLAVCDARTVSARELVAAEIRYPDRTGEIYLVRHSPRHRWHHFAEMDRHEALVFKQYDSQVSGVARFTPHAAFDLPDVPADAPLRESIEIRCLVTYA
jgi:hypothetical protein